MSCSHDLRLGDGASDTTAPLGFPRPTTTAPPRVETTAEPATPGAVEAPLPEDLAWLPTELWQLAGRRSSAPVAEISVLDHGAVADDGQSDSDAFAAAVEAARASASERRPVTVTVPPGRFLLTETLALRSRVVLRGAGKGLTTIELDLDGDREGVTMVGAPTGGVEWMPLARDLDAGDHRLEVPDHGLSTGSFVEIEQDNVDAMVTREEWVVDWGQGSSGMIALVVDVSTDHIVMEVPAVEDFTVARNAVVRPITAIDRAGVESLRIERTDDGYGHSIAMRFGYDLWVRDVESFRASRAHVGIDITGRCEVSGSEFHGAPDYGDGGRAYGISIARHTTACLVTDNALWDLRHAIIIQLGAAGNVIAYNDARGSAGYEDRRPRADISLHGHWPQANLYEGNVVDRVHYADWWGPVGPANVFWRGCALDWVAISESSDDQVIAGSVIGPGGLVIDETVRDTLRVANVVDGAAVVDGVDLDGADLPRSLFAPSPPDPTTTDCTNSATARNPWARPGVDRP